MSDNILSYKGVKICRGNNVLLENVNLELKPNQLTMLVGQIGSGKSTLLRTIFGELPILEGVASVFDIDLKKISKKQIPLIRRQMGLVFQDFKLFENKSVYDNLKFVIDSLNFKLEGPIKNHIEYILELVGIKEKINEMPFNLSGGERQCVCIARAIVCNPKLILADEPTGNLDIDSANNIAQILKNLAQNGTSVLVSTHDREVFDNVADQKIIIENKNLNYF